MPITFKAGQAGDVGTLLGFVREYYEFDHLWNGATPGPTTFIAGPASTTTTGTR